MPWGWVFYQIIGDRRSTKVAKIMAVCYRLAFLQQGQVCFPMHLYGPHTFVREKYWEFQTTSPLKPPGQYFMWSLLGAGKQKIAKMVAVHWPRWLPCPYIVKTFKNLFSRTKDVLGLNLCTNHWGRRSTKVAKMMVVQWPFYGKVKFASLCICMGPLHSYEKNIENFEQLLLWSPQANVAQISCWAWNGCCPLTKMAVMSIYCKNLKKSFSPEPSKPLGLIFAKIIGDRRSTKIAKMMVLCWHLTFLR